MFRKIILMAAILLSTWGIAEAKPLNLNEIQQAVCRVTASQGFEQAKGTGTCIGETSDGYYILTNAHVVGRASSVNLEFFRGGYKTGFIPAKVVWTAYNRNSSHDFAVCKVDKQYFGKYPPRIIRLAPSDYKLQEGYYIASMGCPGGRWAQGWEGHIKFDENNRVIFAPAPIGGQSGSSLVVCIPDNKGELHSRVGAVLTWRFGDGTDATGGAIPIKHLYAAMDGRMPSYNVSHKYTEIARRAYFLGTDGQVYIGTEDDYGHLHVTYPPNVTTQKYLGLNNPYSVGGCEPFGCPSPFQRRQPQPQPQPQPRPQPGNPYGTTPPDITAPWPGAEKPNPEVPGVVVPTPEDDVQDTPNTEDKVKDTPDTSETTLVGIVAGKANNFAGGILAGIGLGFFGLFWHNFLRKRLVYGIDNIQDLIQKKVAKKWGPEAGLRARDMLEGVEEAIMGGIDDFVEDEEATKKVNLNKVRGTLAHRVQNGHQRITGTAKEVVAAVESLANDPEVSEVSADTAAKIKEVLSKG
jgi:hypothetical protein